MHAATVQGETVASSVVSSAVFIDGARLTLNFRLYIVNQGLLSTFCRASLWALNSAVECHLHTVEVVGSSPTAPTISISVPIRKSSHRKIIVSIANEFCDARIHPPQTDFRPTPMQESVQYGDAVESRDWVGLCSAEKCTKGTLTALANGRRLPSMIPHPPHL